MRDALAGFDAGATYAAAASGYDALSSRWRFAAERTVEALQLREGNAVLDVGCGPGAVALLAADHVGNQGSVLGVDTSPEMIALARRHATSLRLTNAAFDVIDMHHLDNHFEPESYDAVASCFALFLADDIPAVLRSMWAILRPGGRLAITTLGPQFFAPAFPALVDSIRQEQPTAHPSIPWRRTDNPAALRAIFATAGIMPTPRITTEVRPIPVLGPSDWWAIACGTGIRALFARLDPAALRRVRRESQRFVRESRLKSLALGAVYAAATKPGASD